MKIAKEQKLYGFEQQGHRYVLRDHALLESADFYLWNDRMFVQIDHRGRSTAMFNQPQHSFYSEELRAFYLRDDSTGELFSVPFDPVCKKPDSFEFSVGIGDIRWEISYGKLQIKVEFVVPRNDTVELWRVSVKNTGKEHRKLTLVNYHPIGFMSWLNNEAHFVESLNAIVCDFFPYYAKVADYYRLREKKNVVACAADRVPTAWECSKEIFCGLSGLHAPQSLVEAKNLGKGDAQHEDTLAAMQFPLEIASGQSDSISFVFGPAHDHKEVKDLSDRYLGDSSFDEAREAVYRYQKDYEPAVKIETPDSDFDAFFNVWLANQALLGGQTNRMDLAPHTRNAILDAMGLSWMDSHRSREMFLRLYQFQNQDGLMPMGVQIDPEVPFNDMRNCFHRDINIWGPIALEVYINETGDLTVLDEKVPFADSKEKATLYDHICRGLQWQLNDRSERGLSLMGEGDWNDPLNMVGYKGKGESVWLTLALSVGLSTWSRILDQRGENKYADACRKDAQRCLDTADKYGWNGDWYVRGFTDEGRAFGTKGEREGRVYVNPQAWSMIAGVNDPERVAKMICAVDKDLQTPFGPLLLGPAYTTMQEDLGRICVKSPGYAENGSVYCHGALFYIHGLYSAGQSEEAFRNLRLLVPGRDEKSLKRNNQLPLYLPSLYHGPGMGYRAGETNKYFRTGSCSWMYLVVTNWLLGMKGTPEGLEIKPQLPKEWPQVKITRIFRGARYEITIRQKVGPEHNPHIIINNEKISGNTIPLQPKGSENKVEVFAHGGL